jgi:hypothetical protein
VTSTDREITPPPAELDGAKVLYWADVSTVALSGAVRHYRDGVFQERFSRIAIAQYAGHTDAYLFHCGPEWAVENDNYYDSVDEAIADAERQYAGFRRESLHPMDRTHGAAQ